MLRQIIQAYRTYGMMVEVEGLIRKMFGVAKNIFSASSMALLEQKELDFDLYARDREINDLVVDIRKKLVEHLNISTSHSVGGELVFLKVITDIERVGDYSKNILDLAKLLKEPFTQKAYYKILKDLLPLMESFFDKSEHALFDGAVDEATDVIQGHLKVNQVCEKLLEDLISDEEVKAPEGIALALTARYFKRVSSHLKNVASTAVNPFPHIGYMNPEEPVVPEKKK